jgi:molecular chaperone GrpE
MSQQKDNLETEAGPAPDTESTAEAAAQEAVAENPEAGDNGDIGTDEDDSPALQLLQAQTTIQDYWDQIIRLRAEMENNRKRAARDVENAHKYALKNFMESLLPVIDSIEMGQVAAMADNATLESIREGLDLTVNMLVQVLQRSGLEQIDPLGEKFDPERHQAISMVDVEGAESNTIVEVMQKGFLLNDRLIRPAMVVVAS